MPQFVVTAPSKSITPYTTIANVADGASLSMTDDRILAYISAGHVACNLQALGEDAASWNNVEDSGGDIAVSAAQQPRVAYGLPTSSTKLRIYNSSGAARNIQAAGWYLA